MKINVYVLDVNYFDGANWSQENLEIKALSIFQLMKCFLKETRCLHHKTQKELWNEYKNRIYKDEVIFPIITRD